MAQTPLAIVSKNTPLTSAGVVFNVDLVRSSKVLAMGLLGQFPVEYDRIPNVLSRVVGILGFPFGIWRYFKERRAHNGLAERERALKATLSRLAHLRKLAKDLEQHPATVRS